MAVNDDTFKDSSNGKIYEGFVDEVKYHNVYYAGVEVLEGSFRLEGDEKNDFKDSKTIPLQAGDYVAFVLKRSCLSSRFFNDILLLNKYDSISGRCLAKYNLYYSGPRNNPYDLSKIKYRTKSF